MAVFLIFLRYNKINKIRSIEIIIKGIHLSKDVIINLSKMKKSNQNHGYVMTCSVMTYSVVRV